MKTEQYVLEWSKANNGFHIQTLADALAWSQRCFLNNHPNNWSVIMVGDKDAVHKMAETHRAKLTERAKAAA